MTRLSSELLRANAYAHGAAGAWTGLRELLVEHEELASLDAELATDGAARQESARSASTGSTSAARREGT